MWENADRIDLQWAYSYWTDLLLVTRPTPLLVQYYVHGIRGIASAGPVDRVLPS